MALPIDAHRGGAIGVGADLGALDGITLTIVGHGLISFNFITTRFRARVAFALLADAAAGTVASTVVTTARHGHASTTPTTHGHAHPSTTVHGHATVAHCHGHVFLMIQQDIQGFLIGGGQRCIDGW